VLSLHLLQIAKSFFLKIAAIDEFCVCSLNDEIRKDKKS
jgi:hypothetical protein